VPSWVWVSGYHERRESLHPVGPSRAESVNDRHGALLSLLQPGVSGRRTSWPVVTSGSTATLVFWSSPSAATSGETATAMNVALLNWVWTLTRMIRSHIDNNQSSLVSFRKSLCTPVALDHFGRFYKSVWASHHRPHGSPAGHCRNTQKDPLHQLPRHRILPSHITDDLVRHGRQSTLSPVENYCEQALYTKRRLPLR
jgi:hypothetical protein